MVFGSELSESIQPGDSDQLSDTSQHLCDAESVHMLGREVKTLVNERQTAGTHLVTFDAGNLASGVYFYRMQAGSFVQTKKLILMK